MSEQSSIPKGRLKRGSVVGIAAAKAGLKKAGNISKRPFLPKAKRKFADDRTDEEIARIIFNALCVLRGTALKAAQLIAMEMEFIPEAYRLELQKASSQVPPMNRALVRKVVKSQLGAPEKVFKTFSPIPFAAASLGQVHAATSQEGQQLAVKVQYPDIAAGVTSDIDLLKRVLSPTRYRKVFSDCIEEIQKKISEELDYQKEASHTKAFQRALDANRYVVPSVEDKYSTTSILTMSRIDGLHLHQWLATGPPQSLRNHYGQLLVDLFNECMYRERLIHADPNPGNFLFRPDGRLGVIDFGCVSRLSPEFSRTVFHLVSSKDITTSEVLEKLHNKIGIHYRNSADPKALSRFLKKWFNWLKEPYRGEIYDFSKASDYFRRGTGFAKEFYALIERYEGSFVYFGRTSHGLMRMLEQLGAKVRMSPEGGRLSV
ncbi:MAG: AarF/ABC1/UbiB kinase family protein [Myxococcota bacterium]|nr:AarF/ABC1/UbiB kinase family protein [Myxococcota bacterium]